MSARTHWPLRAFHARRRLLRLLLCVLPALIAGCGDIFGIPPAPLFSAPLAIEGEPVGSAIIDTGGDYELMLRESFGLKIVDTAEVLAFGGVEVVGITEAFTYSIGSVDEKTPGALVGVSVCNCNGLGYHFFRKTGTVVGLDFANQQAVLAPVVPAGGVTIPFALPPASLDEFDSAFVDVVIASGHNARRVVALFDSGSNTSVLRRGVLAAESRITPDRLNVTITEPRLGTVAAQLGLFDTPGLPDLIVGTDIMRVWSDRWYFFFSSSGGTLTVFPRAEDETAPVNDAR
jgi:hypothetical protein